MSKFAIGIDIGGTHISGAIANQNGIIKTKKTITFIKPPDGKKGLQLIKKIISHLSSLVSHLSLLGVGIACPGSVDSEKGIVLADSPNLIGWKGTKIKQPLEAIFGLPVLIDNDANLAALGEKAFGVGKNARNLICLTLGTGIGGGIIINNKIYRGSHFYAGEIGHMKVLPDGPVCSCRQRGCLESLSSAKAIVRNYNKATSFKISSAEAVFDRARKGHKIASDVIDRAISYLGIAIASLINIFDPDMVILSGGIAQAGSILIEKVRLIANQNIMPYHQRYQCLPCQRYRQARIVLGKLGPYAGLLGASALVFERPTNYE